MVRINASDARSVLIEQLEAAGMDSRADRVAASGAPNEVVVWLAVAADSLNTAASSTFNAYEGDTRRGTENDIVDLRDDVQEMFEEVARRDIDT